MTYIVVGEYCWGRGETEEAALAKATKAGGKHAVKKNLVYESDDPEAYVHDDGGFCWHTGFMEPRLVKRVDGRKIEIVQQGSVQ